MSLTYTQLIALIDDTVGSNSVSYPVADKTRDINLALDRALALIFQASGKWQFDDTNHSGFPELFADIVSGTRRYAFTADANSILTLDIYKVLILQSATATIYEPLKPIDAQSDRQGLPIAQGDTATGIPFQYDKTGKWIDLDPIPNYNATNGIKLIVNREASYFTTSDTTKKPGIAGVFHEYCALRPSYQYAYRKSLPLANSLLAEVNRLEAEMVMYYARREKDVRHILKPRITNFR